MSPEQMQQAAKKLAYHVAIADVVRASRDFALACMALERAANAYDPEGTVQDEAATAFVGDIQQFLAAAAATPGIRQLMVAAVTEGAPDAPVDTKES